MLEPRPWEPRPREPWPRVCGPCLGPTVPTRETARRSGRGGRRSSDEGACDAEARTRNLQIPSSRLLGSSSPSVGPRVPRFEVRGLNCGLSSPGPCLSGVGQAWTSRSFQAILTGAGGWSCSCGLPGRGLAKGAEPDPGQRRADPMAAAHSPCAGRGQGRALSERSGAHSNGAGAGGKA